MRYIVFDLEATCWSDGDLANRDNKQETIEIGAVALDERFESVGEFSEFVKPVRQPVLSEFCTELTSIRQSDVDGADYFWQVIERFQEWCGAGDYVLCSWGNFDMNLLEADGVDLSEAWASRHVNVKTQYRTLTGNRAGLERALELEQIKPVGTQHRAIDDARNTAQLVIKYRDRWDWSQIEQTNRTC